MSNASKSSNPFEEQWAKKTHKSGTVKKRQRSLLRDTQPTSGRNRFDDQRVGEKNPKLTDEDRYIARLQRERSRGARKKERFNLSDAADANPPLSGVREEFPIQDPEAWKYFVLKNARDDYDETVGHIDPSATFAEPLDAVDEDDLDNRHIEEKEEEDDDNLEVDGPKSHRDIMNEVMQKSKMFKAERQHVKAVDELQREAMDQALPELLSLLMESGPSDSTPETQTPKGTEFNYEAEFRSLAGERRARASSRTKTEAELEAEERERLEELERTRLNRMRDLPDDDDDAGSGDENVSEIVNRTEKRVSEYTKPILAVSENVANLITDPENVPFVFEKCPSDSSELSELLGSYSSELRGVVIERVRKCFAVSLDAANNSKLQRLFGLLLERVTGLSATKDDVVSVGAEINDLTNCLYALATKYPATLIDWSRERIYKAYRSLQADELTQLSCCWSHSELLVFRLITTLFPGSDIRHGVMTPLLLLICEALSPKRLHNHCDFVLACFLCSIALRVGAASTRSSGQITQFLEFGLKKYSDSNKRGSTASDHLRVALRLEDCLETTVETEATELLGLRISRTLRKLTVAALYGGRIANPDLLFAPVLRSETNDETIATLKRCFESRSTSRKPLTLYSEKNVVVPKALNPKFTATHGVYKKHDRYRPGLDTVKQKQDAIRRIGKSMRKEERGYARELRREALAAAQERDEKEASNRAFTNKKTRDLQLFLEDQQSTWNKAAKRQKKLSGKKW